MSIVSSDKSTLLHLKRPSLNLYALTAVVVGLALIGSILVLSFARVQENRELMAWQNKLNLIADSRAEAVEGWLVYHFKELDAVTANPSLQIYMTQLQVGGSAKAGSAEESMQSVFLRNLLGITADRLGFIEKAPRELADIKASLPHPTGSGLAIIDANGKVLVATAGLAQIDESLAARIAKLPEGQSALIDIYSGPSDAMIGFISPIYPIQADAGESKPIGRLVGVKVVGDDFYKLLKHPGVTDKTLEAVLIRQEGDNVTYLSPSRDGAPLATKLAINTPRLDAAYAIKNPGNFAQRQDQASVGTLMTSRPIAKAPWILLLHISRDQALADSDQWRIQTEYIMFFALLAIVCGYVAVWHYSTSRRTWILSQETHKLAEQLASREKLLSLVSDNQPEPIMIVDSGDITRFGNRRAAQSLHALPEDIIGKSLTALFGPARAAEYAESNQKASKLDEPVRRTWRNTDEGIEQVIFSSHIPLPHVPIDGLPTPCPGVLIVDQDVTEVVVEREKRMTTMQELIDALVHIVDKRDHNAANHSQGVALVAGSVASGMKLDDRLVRTAEVAGKLMNIGKIVVPSEILTRDTPLAKDELQFIRESLKSSAEILQNITFDGPVVDTLRQMQECFNGTGPLGLKGEAILVTARIIAVANAFVSMISQRSYRQAMPVDQAIKALLSDHDMQFDHRIVVALANFVENQDGQEVLTKLLGHS